MMTILKIWLLLSDTVLIALITGLPATVAALAALIVSMKGNRKVATVVEKVDEVKTVVAEQVVKVAAVVDEVKTVVAEQVVRVEKVVEKVDQVKNIIAEQVLKSDQIVGAVDGYHKEVNGNMKILLEKTELLAKAEQKIQNGKTE